MGFTSRFVCESSKEGKAFCYMYGVLIRKEKKHSSFQFPIRGKKNKITLDQFMLIPHHAVTYFWPLDIVLHTTNLSPFLIQGSAKAIVSSIAFSFFFGEDPSAEGLQTKVPVSFYLEGLSQIVLDRHLDSLLPR